MLAAVTFAQWFPWVLLLISVAMLLALALRFAALYRSMKKAKLQREQASREPDATLGVDGEWFVLHALCPYRVGEGGQLAAGPYLLRMLQGESISLQINGAVVDYLNGEVLSLRSGDTLRAERDVCIKPHTQE